MDRISTETYNLSVLAPNATMVFYGILYGGMHPIDVLDRFKSGSPE